LYSNPFTSLNLIELKNLHLLAANGASGKIKNVVLLVLENRSFDRILGWANYTSAINGLTGKEYNLVNPADPTSTKIYAGRHGLLKDPLDPPHGIDDVTKQISGDPNAQSVAKLNSAPMTGFVAEFAASLNISLTNVTALGQIMNGFDP
jgi:phospholipase C